MNVREFITQLGGGTTLIEAPDTTVYDLTVKETHFPSETQQGTGIFLVIRTEDGPMHLRLDEKAYRTWNTGLQSHLHVGAGTRRDWEDQMGPCPNRRLVLTRSLEARAAQPQPRA